MNGAGKRESLTEVRSPEWLELAVRALGPLRPPRLRRFERARELIELLARAGDPSEALEAFDLERGASGRPQAVSEFVPGTTAVSGSRKELRHGRNFGSWIRLDRGELELGDSRRGKVRRIPIEVPGRPSGGRRTGRGVAELVWFEALVPLGPRTTRVFRERALLLADGQGFCLAVVENIPFTPEGVFQLARAAGIPAAAYRVRCLDGQVDEILELMFPRRRRVRTG